MIGNRGTELKITAGYWAIFRSIFYNGHPKFDQIVQMANQNFSLAPVKPKVSFSALGVPVGWGELASFQTTF